MIFWNKEQTKELTTIYVGLYRKLNGAMHIAYKL